MKSIIICLTAVAVFAVTQTQGVESDPRFKCPQNYLNELKPVTLKNFFGIWYVVRATPCQEGMDSTCITQTLWRTRDTPENTVNSMCSARTNGTWEFEQGQAIVKPSGTVDGQVDNHWEIKMMNITGISVFIDSDNGQNWGVGHTCIEMDGNATSMWSVMSRTRKMDAKLEQTLVERIEKYSGLTQDKLRGIQQTDCYLN